MLPCPASLTAGRYRVVRFLGEGGKKRVYLAHDTPARPRRGLRPHQDRGARRGRRASAIRREAQAMGRLGDHPHIVTVYDIGEEAGQPYIVTELHGAAATSRA